MKDIDIRPITDAFGLTFREVTDCIDTSRNDTDKRINFILDRSYVLKINSPLSMQEDRLQQISRLIERYHSIGVYCPRIIPALSGRLSVPYDIGGTVYTCYVEEFASAPICTQDTDVDRKEVLRHLGTLASRYTNVDLTDIRSMWSIFDLAPLDTDVDEKQENADLLVDTLKKAALPDLSESVRLFNEHLRSKILPDFPRLPRCVFQGDLNASNILHRNGHFSGLIDFNMSGTDVNINVFTNETCCFPSEEDFDSKDVGTLVRQMDDEQEDMLTAIWSQYTPDSTELRVLPYFKGICSLFQWPNVCDLQQWLKDPSRREKAALLIEEIIRTFQ